MNHMKDLTEEKILKLKDEQIENYVKLAYADAGIKLIKKPIEPTYEEVPETDKILYQVEGIDICFTKKETAEEVAKVLKNNFSSLRKHDYNYNYDSTKKYEQPLNKYDYPDGINSIQVKEIMVYSQELYHQLQDAFGRDEKLKGNYNKLKEEYDKWFEDANAIRENIMERISKIRTKQDEKERMLERFNEYYQLAENNEKVAWAFMEKAYTVGSEQKDYIKANFKKVNKI